jgi:hypothetical protein
MNRYPDRVASNLLIAGESDVKAARWLGHCDTRMLHKHYGQMLSYLSGVPELMNLIGDRFEQYAGEGKQGGSP